MRAIVKLRRTAVKEHARLVTPCRRRAERGIAVDSTELPGRAALR